MGDKVRVAVLEANGTELDYETEYDLNAELVELDPPVGGYDDVDQWIRAQSGGSTDHHAGWHEIIAGQTVEIVDRKQMRISGPITITGTVIINGILVLD